jgi:hypothetical protein
LPGFEALYAVAGLLVVAFFCDTTSEVGKVKFIAYGNSNQQKHEIFEVKNGQ